MYFFVKDASQAQSTFIPCCFMKALRIGYVLLLMFVSSRLLAGDSAKIHISPAAGMYADSQTITFINENKSAAIYYTLDGSKPSRAASKYRAPIEIHKTTVVRAIAYHNNKPSGVITATYLIGTSHTLPVVSIATNPANFFSYEKGIYVKGCCADSVQPYHGANFWKGWERKVNIEYFDSQGKIRINQNAGVRIFGGFSKGLPMKSLAIIARKKYGRKHFKYSIFSEKKEIKKYKSFILRNSGGDFNKSHFRDALITQITRPTSLPIQAYQPVVVYINGSYWGIQNAREKLNESYFKFNYGASTDSIDIMKHRNDVQVGTRTNYKALLKFLKNTNLADNENVALLNQRMNISNYLDHHIIQVYADNGDAGGNIRYWRPQTPQGRWNWVLFDTDLSMGIGNKKAYKVNTLKEMTTLSDEKWPNPQWSTFIIRKLLENDSLKSEYIFRFTNYLNTIYSERTVGKTIDSIYNLIAEEMVMHRKRWGGRMSTWERNVQRLRDFANKRPTHLRSHLQQVFSLGDTIQIEIDPPGEGVKRIIFNNMKIQQPFKGTYFKSFPFDVEIKIQSGYKFMGWKGLGETPKSTKIIPVGNLKLEPIVTKRDTSNYWDKIIFNEINYFNKDIPREKDWVELKNISEESVDLSGWKLKIDQDKAVAIINMTLNPGEYIVLSGNKDSLLFASPELDGRRIVGMKRLKLNRNHFRLLLIDGNNRIADSLSVDHTKKHSKAIYLKTPTENNHTLDSWLSTNETTPNELNHYEKKIEEEKARTERQVYYAGLALLVLGIILLILHRLRKKRKVAL